MSADHYKRGNCRLCEGTQLELVVPIVATPVADAYVSQDKLGEVQDCYPLDLYQCLSCGHVQLLDVVAPSILFKHYSYFTGRTPALLKHFGTYAQNVIRKADLKEGARVFEIGSNDGTFLRFFRNAGLQVLGLDPAENVARLANESGIETIVDYFNLNVARRIREEKGAMQVVAANNVFAHADDMSGMAAGVQTLLASEGIFVFEVSYLLDVVDHMLVGTIFHEHVCYHSVRPLDEFLHRHGMELIDVERVGLQGGSIICTAQLVGGPRKPAPAVREFKAREDARCLHEPATLREFSAKLEALRTEASLLVNRLHAEGNTVAAFGAARSGTLLIYHIDLGKTLRFIVDDSPDKQHLFSPGYHIPVLPTSELYERRPEYTFILAWVHTKAIIHSHRRYLEEGGKFIACFPRIEIITKDSALG